MLNKITKYIFLLCIILGLALNIFSLEGGHSFSGDSAQYIIHAKNLIEGSDYSKNIMLDNPLTYPPGLPVLIAPIIYFFGINFIVFKFLNIVLWFAGILFFYFFAKQYSTKKAAAYCAVVLACSSYFFVFKHRVLSDVPFFFFLNLSLFLFERYTQKINKRYFFAFLVTISFAFLIRSAGVVLFISSLFYFIFIRRNVKNVLLTGAFFLISYLVQYMILGGNSPGFIDNIISNPIQSLVMGAKNSFLVWMSVNNALLPEKYIWVAYITYAVKVLLITVSPVIYLLMGFLFFKKLRDRSLHFMECFLFFYILMLFLWSGVETLGFARFILPVVGLILLAGYKSLKVVLALKWKNIKIERALKGVCIFIISVNFFHNVYYFDSYKNEIDAQENKQLIEWVGNNLAGGESYIFAYPRTIALLTEKVGTTFWAILKEHGSQVSFLQLPEILRAKGIDYAILTKTLDKQLIAFFDQNPHIANGVWENGGYKIFSIK